VLILLVEVVVGDGVGIVLIATMSLLMAVLYVLRAPLTNFILVLNWSKRVPGFSESQLKAEISALALSSAV